MPRGGGRGRQRSGNGRRRNRNNNNNNHPNNNANGPVERSLNVYPVFNPTLGRTVVEVRHNWAFATTGNPLTAPTEEHIKDLVHRFLHDKVVGESFNRITSRKFGESGSKEKGSKAVAVDHPDKTDEDKVVEKSPDQTSSSLTAETSSKDERPQTTSGGRKRKHSEVEEAERCPICLGDYEEGVAMKTLYCGHEFHEECLKTCFENQARCPVCRQCGQCRSADAFQVNFVAI